MLIRLAEERDIPGILDLLLQVGEVHHQLRPDIFRSGAQKYDRQALLSLLADPLRPIFVADRAGAVAGYAFCIQKSQPENSVMLARREFYIDDLCVDENQRGQGVATALYRHVCVAAKECGCDFVTLNVWQGNKNALAFYEKMGLRPRNTTMELPLEDMGC